MAKMHLLYRCGKCLLINAIINEISFSNAVFAEISTRHVVWFLLIYMCFNKVLTSTRIISHC